MAHTLIIGKNQRLTLTVRQFLNRFFDNARTLFRLNHIRTFVIVTDAVIIMLNQDCTAFAQNARAQAVTTEMADDTGVEAVYYDDETGLTDEDIKYMKACREMMAKELETLDPEARMIRMEEIREKYHNKTGLIDWKAEYEQMTADTE